MPNVEAFYSDSEKEKRYHNNSSCGPGSEIPAWKRIKGTGGHKLCQDCARLNADKK